MTALGSSGLTLLSFALVISAVVFFHELGHLIVAKLVGVKAIRFSIGFGPRLFGFKLGETEYRLSALPLGGYVKFAGDNPYEELAAEDRGRGFLEQPPWKRGLIAVAGPAANFLLSIAVYFVLFSAPHQELAAKVGYVKPDSPAAHAGLQYADRIQAIDGEAVSGWLSVREKIEAHAGEPLDLTVERDGRVVQIRIVPAIHEEANPIETIRRGRIGIAAVPRNAEVTVVSPGSPAGQAGLRTFDLVAKLDGDRVANYEDLARKLARREGPIELDVLRRKAVEAPGATLWSSEPLHLSVAAPVQPGAYGIEASDMTLFAIQPGSAAADAGLRRGDRILEAEGKPVYDWGDDLDTILRSKGAEPVTLTIRRDGQELKVAVRQHLRKTRDETGSRAMVAELGASPDYAVMGEGERISVRYGLADAARRSVVNTFGIVRSQILGIVRIATGHISTDAIGGPLMIADVARKAAEAGGVALLQTIAIISIALGVMNLLPVPVLDGFHVLSAIIEGIRRRPLSVRFREVANVVGIALLLCLMLFAFRNDAMRKWFE